MPSIANKVDAEQFFEANRLIQWYLDEPMPNPAEVPLYFLAQNARKYVKVVLSGEGADELFGGYPMYCQAVHFMDYEHKVPKALRKAAGAVASKLPDFKGKHFLVRGAEEPWQRYMRANYVFLDPAERDRCLKKNYHSPARNSSLSLILIKCRVWMNPPSCSGWICTPGCCMISC